MKSLINTWSRLFSITLLIINTTNISAEVCQKLEFSELESISKEELLRMRCSYLHNATQFISAAPEVLQSGSGTSHQNSIESDRYENESNNCMAEIIRLDRIIVKRYNLKPTGLYHNTNGVRS
jgi:hypothetical protein